jgi:hypothetical protein
METLENLEVWEDQSRAIVHQSYLGFRIEEVWGLFMAIPEDWPGERIFAASLPMLRRRVWRWWHQVV